MIRPSVLLFALLMSAPAWYRLLLDEVDIIQVLTRFLIAVPIAAVLLAGLRFILAGYRTTEETPGRPVSPDPIDPSAPERPA
jgi:ABC-type Na+ efflux pump permease subunit